VTAPYATAKEYAYDLRLSVGAIQHRMRTGRCRAVLIAGSLRIDTRPDATEWALPEGDAFTTAQLADLWRVHRRTVQRLAGSGALATRPGGGWGGPKMLTPREAAVEFLRGAMVRGSPTGPASVTPTREV
jgi:hypothetical protein